MDEMKKLGNKVILITSSKLRDKNWPWHAIDETFYMNESAPSVWNMEHLVQGFSHLLTTRKVSAVVALDDYDVEKAALIRETFRIPGMGQTTHRYFRDKLAMRQQALDTGISVPEFTSIFNNDDVTAFVEKISPPWVLKPRSEASASGIKKLHTKEDLWQAIENLKEERHLFLLESFKPGDVYHVDSLTYHKDIVFTCCSKYLAPPMSVSHDGGVFRTKTLNRYSDEFAELSKINEEVLHNFGLQNGATHTEFIRGTDGKYYFLETSSRVGGANIPDLVEAATGINIWREWARLENSLLNKKEYTLAKPTGFSAGLLISLANEKNPDTTPFDSDEVHKYITLDHHIGIVFKSNDEALVQRRLDEAADLVTEKLLNVIPPQTKPTS